MEKWLKPTEENDKKHESPDNKTKCPVAPNIFLYVVAEEKRDNYNALEKSVERPRWQFRPAATTPTPRLPKQELLVNVKPAQKTVTQVRDHD